MNLLYFCVCVFKEKRLKRKVAIFNEKQLLFFTKEIFLTTNTCKIWELLIAEQIYQA